MLSLVYFDSFLDKNPLESFDCIRHQLGFHGVIHKIKTKNIMSCHVTTHAWW